MTSAAATTTLATTFETFAHEDHPLMQSVRAARRWLPAEHDEIDRTLRSAIDGAVVESVADGFCLYGRDEPALERAVARVTGYRWQHVVVAAVEVRCRDNPWRVPWMNVRVRASRRLSALLRDDLCRRHGRVTAAAFVDDLVFLSGSAPLTGLLGYATWVLRRADGRASVETRLTGWRIVDRDPHIGVAPAA